MAQVHRRSIGSYDVVTIVSGPPWKQNCHLVAAPSEGALAIVDPGADSAELDSEIKAIGLEPTLLLVTHGHPDHLGAAARLSAEHDLECLVGSGDERVVRHAPAYAAAFGKLPLRLPQRIRFIGPDADIRLGSEPIGVLPLPGHTPGSLAFQIGGLILTGDTLFRGQLGRTDLPAGDSMALIRSVDLMLTEVDDETIQIVPGHGPPWSIGEARRWWRRAGRAAAMSIAS